MRNSKDFEEIENESQSILAENAEINKKQESIYLMSQNDILTSMTEDCDTVRKQTHSEVQREMKRVIK